METKRIKFTVATLLQAQPGMWAFECLGPNVPLELEPTRCGLIIQCGRYNFLKQVKSPCTRIQISNSIPSKIILKMSVPAN